MAVLYLEETRKKIVTRQIDISPAFDRKSKLQAWLVFLWNVKKKQNKIKVANRCSGAMNRHRLPQLRFMASYC